jgi:hypothetical protein
MDSADFPGDLRINVALVARLLLLSPVAQKFYRYEQGVFMSRTCVHSRTIFLIEAAVGIAFSNACPDKDVPNKTIILSRDRDSATNNNGSGLDD